MSSVRTWWQCWTCRGTGTARRAVRRRVVVDSLSSLLCGTQGAQGWPRTCRRREWTPVSLRNAFTCFALTREKKEAGRIILTAASTYTTPALLLVISPVLSSFLVVVREAENGELELYIVWGNHRVGGRELWKVGLGVKGER